MARPDGQGGIDYPDGGFYSGQQSTALVGDLGEHAVRTGSIYSYDRQGNVVWQDDFRHGLTNWHEATSGTGAEIKAVSTFRLNGPYACQLTGGSDSSKYAMIDRYEHVLPVGKMGIQCAFSLPGSIDRLIIWFRYYDGSQAYQGRVEVDDVNDEISIYTEPNTDTKIADLDWAPRRGDIFNRIKLVCDFSTGYYTRLLFNNLEYDISSYEIDLAVSSTEPSIFTWIQLYSRSGNNDIAYIDDVIITQSEP